MWAVWWRCDGAVSQVIIRPALSSRNQDNYILNIVTQQTFFISTVDTVDTQTISTSFCILYTANRQFKPPLNYWISLPKTIPRLALRLGPERHDCAKQRAKQRAKRWWRWWHLTTLTMASPHLHDVIRHVCDVWRTFFLKPNCTFAHCLENKRLVSISNKLWSPFWSFSTSPTCLHMVYPRVLWCWFQNGP